MTFRFRRVMLALPLAAVTAVACVPNAKDAAKIPARVIALGIPGAGAVAKIGNFLTGGPIHDRPTTFGLFTQPGEILEPKRVFVASTSNFGAPLARAGEAEGAIIAICPSAAGEPFGGA